MNFLRQNEPGPGLRVGNGAGLMAPTRSGLRRSLAGAAVVMAAGLGTGLNLAAADSLVPVGAPWRYLDTGIDPGVAWRGTDYVDGSWALGNGQLGFGDGDEATILNGGPSGGRYPTVYFRHTFVVTNRAALTNLAVRFLRDDGGVVYLNGVEVFRSNMPDAPAVHNMWSALSTAGSDENAYFGGAIPPGLLVSGTNVLAAEVHQDSPSSSDLSFSLELLANTTLGNQAPVVTVALGTNGPVVGANESFTLQATAADAESAIARVDLTQNGQIIQTIPGASGTLTWSNATVGLHDYAARAMDTTGMLGFSAPLRVMVVPAGFQSQTAFFPQFTSAGGLMLFNDATISSNVLHLMRPNGTGKGSAWMAAPQGVSDGFMTEFRFRINSKVGGGADGFAFVLGGFAQPMTGSGGIGYNNLTNCLSVEFDTWQNSGDADPDDHHIGVHSRGLLGNTQSESASLGLYTPPVDYSDGAVHRVRLLYQPGSLLVYLDNFNVPVLSLNVNLGTLLSLPNGTAWLGFTAGSGASSENHDILAWSHTSFANTPPTVALTSPARATRVLPGSELVLGAEAHDANGSILGVLFIENGHYLGLATNVPYRLDWNVPAGVHILTALTADDQNFEVLSAPQVVEALPAAANVAWHADFSGATNLELQGQAALVTNRLRLTAAINSQAGAAWLSTRQAVAFGFESVFQFQISQLAGNGGDGLAFVIQNNVAPLLGDAGAGMGYRTIPNSLAVEFDTYQNSEVTDPDANHIGIHTRGAGANTSHEEASLARAAPWVDMSDGAIHTAVIRYRDGLLQVFLDDLSGGPVLQVATNLDALLGLEGGPAWVGFTAATGGAYENHDVLMWTFRSNARPQVQTPWVTGAGPFVAPTNLMVQSSASDPDGLVARVEFYADNILIGSAAAAPYGVTWTNAPAGTHAVVARAVDDMGGTMTSAVVPITVWPTPFIERAVPGSNGTYRVEFVTVPEQRYRVQYSVDLWHWSNAVPSLTGNGALLQWLDNGPPGTDSHPSTQHQRFYRVLLE